MKRKPVLVKMFRVLISHIGSFQGEFGLFLLFCINPQKNIEDAASASQKDAGLSCNATGVTLVIVGNRIDDPSSKHGRGYLYFP